MFLEFENCLPTAFFSLLLFRTGGVFSSGNLFGNVVGHPPREGIVAASETERFN
jgi:hypothetical protein